MPREARAQRRRLVPAVPLIETRRLRMRPLTPDDLDWYLAHFSRPEIVRGTGFPAPTDREAARAEMDTYIFDLFESGNGLRWGLELVATGELVGSIGFYRWVNGPPRAAEVGYDLDPAHWGRGLMLEALQAALRFGFNVMRLQRVEATVLPGNDRSLRLLERAGFWRERTLPRHGTDEHGTLSDEVLMSLDRGVWRILGR